MARSPFTLAAAVTAALPGAEVVGARTLTAGGDGRFDSAVATLADGRELAIRVGDDDETSRELASESLALRALTAGARAMLPFRAPEYCGETLLAEGRALVADLLPGFQIEASHVPGGRGAAESIGASIAAVHALPASVVRGAGLTARSAAESREEVRQLVDRAAATGRVPARLTVRWREAVSDDDLWRFESAVTLGGIQATSFLFEDDPDQGPIVVGLLNWHGLSLGDPAVDLAWLSSAPDAAGSVHASYADASDRAPDAALAVRGRLLAELEFARWLVHGDTLHRTDIMDDAASLLGSLADGLRENDLAVIATRGEGVDSALDALDRVPATATVGTDTSMQTDAYNPADLLPGEDALDEATPHEHAERPEDATEDLSDVAAAWGADPSTGSGSGFSGSGSGFSGSGSGFSGSGSGLLGAAASVADPSTGSGSGLSGSGSGLSGSGSGLSGSGSGSGLSGSGSGSGLSGSGSGLPGSGSGSGAGTHRDESTDSADEAQRAARAALQRWTSSSSE